MNFVQPEPKIVIQIAEAPFVVIPPSVEIYTRIPSFLKHHPTSSSCFLITEHIKCTQTIRIDFVHSTDIVTRLVNFSAILQEN